MPLFLCGSVYKSPPPLSQFNLQKPLHRQGRSNLLANFLPLSRRGKLKTRFLTRRRVRYRSVATGAHCAPLQVGANIAHRGALLIHRYRGLICKNPSTAKGGPICLQIFSHLAGEASKSPTIIRKSIITEKGEVRSTFAFPSGEGGSRLSADG